MSSRPSGNFSLLFTDHFLCTFISLHLSTSTPPTAPTVKVTLCVSGGTLRMYMTCHGQAMGISWFLALWTTLPSCGIYRRVMCTIWLHACLQLVFMYTLIMQYYCAYLCIVCFMQVRRYASLMTTRAMCRVYPGIHWVNILAHLAVIGNVCVCMV